MKWKGRRASSNVDDARGRRAVGRSSGAGLILSLVARRFGIKGILLVLVLGFIAVKSGLVDPAMLTGGSVETRETAYRSSAQEQELFEFVSVVLADTEDVWSAEFSRRGLRYEEPELVVFKDSVPTACGTGSARMGPFYCPGDRKIYIDLGFYDELDRALGAPGDFAQAYVIAHEVGHHVQNLLGISGKVHAMRGRSDYNEYSVRLELQADYYAGLWADRNRHYLDRGDIEEAMRAANAIGDDAMQSRTRGKVVPHAFTHGTSEQRMRWFERGLGGAGLEHGDTFSMPYSDL